MTYIPKNPYFWLASTSIDGRRSYTISVRPPAKPRLCEHAWAVGMALDASVWPASRPALPCTGWALADAAVTHVSLAAGGTSASAMTAGWSL